MVNTCYSAFCDKIYMAGKTAIYRAIESVLEQVFESSTLKCIPEKKTS